ncbi:MAG: hypothetical protein ACK46Q_01430 [Hyphomonas sp.]
MTENEGTEEEFEASKDKSVYFTLSLYVSKKKVTETLGRPLTPAFLRDFQPGYRDSKWLRDAVEPLFNDIADRERLGEINDFLLDTPCPEAGDIIEVTAPEEIRWTTEGLDFVARPPGLQKARRLRVLRFWYTHANGAVSYHLSFCCNYDHTPGDFYFLSLLQKVAAPKEFSAASRPAGSPPIRAADDDTGIAPLDQLRVNSPQGPDQSFWQYIRSVFDSDAADLFGKLGLAEATRKHVPLAPSFDNMVTTAPFIEVPGLVMPVSRLMFFFQDDTFFRRVLPKPETDEPAASTRTRMVQEECYLPFQTELKKLKPRDEASGRDVRLGKEYWEWVLLRPDYDHYTDEQIAAARTLRPAIEDRRRQDCVQYLFIAGFNQNIIDFMNQDPSEILDSIDPIYPATEEQAKERKFVRFANPRAIITYVEKARSLEAGYDYIGTCPYAFLIHAASLHNELMTYEYESEAFSLIKQVEDFGKKNSLNAAAKAFYDFRTGVYTDYYRDRYMNIFRYDTEAEVFRRMTEVRGIARRNEYVERLVSNMESQTRDREARLAKKDETSMNVLLGALGVFGLFQLAMMWAEKLRELQQDDSLELFLSWAPPFLHLTGEKLNEPGNAFSLFVLYFSMVFTLVLLLVVAWRLIRVRRR